MKDNPRFTPSIYIYILYISICLWLQARFFERRLYGVEAVLISSGKREIRVRSG